MSDIAIAVENLSKSYLIGHQASQREPYTALRDVIAREARNFVRRGLDLIRGREIVQGDELEQFWALRDVSFEVKRGEVFGIVGRNGAGKSTLLKILSRITEPDRGRAVVRGRVASLLEVGTGFHAELTGRENIFLNGAILGMTRAEIRKKFDEIVAFAEVERFLDMPVKRYSSGMYVRLAFAVAAHLEPEILIVDEVLAVGDSEFQRKCLGKMHEVSTKDGRTVLFVSHNMAAVESMCGSALLLVGGQSAAQGSTAKVVGEYLRDLTRITTLPLGDRTDRSGSGELRFASISLERAGGIPVSAFQCGADAVLHLVAENRTSRELRRLEMSLGIDNETGQRVALVDTMLIGADISGLSPGPASVRVLLPKLGLVPGRYRLTVYATVSGVIVDWIKNAAVFDVEAGDYYGSGQLPPQGQAMFLLDHQFIVNSGQHDTARSSSCSEFSP
jgi:lipopolysaccharide transport system ATP-binding protein